VGDVFTRAGWVLLPPPPGLTYLFAPRTTGPFFAKLRTGSAISVTLTQEGDADDSVCRVVVEAVAPDPSCPEDEPIECLNPNLPMASAPPPASDSTNYSMQCRPWPPMCPFTAAPTPQNDAMVDELARRIRTALGETGHVN
jgi:hypothetical protein